ncbi:hypothetical protein BO70DRAFT_386434 [Aspergillus heteromorphus CBS 117.55]|uniref:Rhodopsin domain-containing protein n=1 Tax=Aspergillus heteromorphus CBS 117.55 TaxID=1448321 RepID=A0A317WM83_9EURO|nr:uncharacterized protein BO70DRAFT_386434 [Aspergillus heteromorphus CBS 117.55]PWY86157.1 hypothetical protein BO70DRAFT_386434 [Aspergillus heteromorphus CBS 117.55]
MDDSSISPPYSYRHSLQPWDVATQTVCLAVSTLCIAMRLYSKLHITKAPGWEDLTCCLAWLGLIGYAILAFEADRHGSGVHQWEVDASDLRQFSKLANASQILYGPLIFVTKLSIFLLYVRVFAPSPKCNPFWFIQLIIALNLLFYFADTVVKICECTPRARIWDKDVPGHCININIPILVTSIVNVVSDIIMLLMPILCVWRLQITVRRKLGISAIFAAGIFGCISSVMRLAVSIGNRYSTDKTYDWFPEFLWTTAEITSGILASSLPALPTFYKHTSQKAKTLVRSISTGSFSTFMKKSVSTGNRSGSEAVHQPAVRRPWQGDPSRTNLVAGSDWEMAEIGPFQGTCYTTAEATAERDGERGFHSNVDSLRGRDGERCEPRDGILKIVEVDVESGPGGRT